MKKISQEGVEKNRQKRYRYNTWTNQQQNPDIVERKVVLVPKNAEEIIKSKHGLLFWFQTEYI